MPSYTQADEQVFALVAQATFETPSDLVSVESIVKEAESQHLPREDVLLSLRFLAENQLIALGPRESHAQLTGSRIERWAHANLDYEALQDRLGRAIMAANGRTNSRQLGHEVDAPDIVVRHVIRSWGNTGELKVGRPVMAGGELLPVTGMSATFRRRYSD